MSRPPPELVIPIESAAARVQRVTRLRTLDRILEVIERHHLRHGPLGPPPALAVAWCRQVGVPAAATLTSWRLHRAVLGLQGSLLLLRSDAEAELLPMAACALETEVLDPHAERVGEGKRVAQAG